MDFVYYVEPYHSSPKKTWGVYCGLELICVCLYKKGAEKVCRILNGVE